MKKRNLFNELAAGFQDLADEREGKTTLRTVKAELKTQPVEISSGEIKQVRESRKLSQAVMAGRLRVNLRTYQNWEQGTAKPNTQAAVLIKLVEKNPKLLEDLATLA